MVPEKGLRYLIKGVPGQVDTGKKLVIAGGSSDTNAFMQELKELTVGDDRIIFTGFIQGQTLDELYSNAYVYCLPSDLEDAPESAGGNELWKLCCLASDIAECTEVVEDKALAFKKSDVSDLKDKLQFACDYPEEVKKLKAGSAGFICKKYSWDDVGKADAEIISKTDEMMDTIKGL